MRTARLAARSVLLGGLLLSIAAGQSRAASETERKVYAFDLVRYKIVLPQGEVIEPKDGGGKDGVTGGPVRLAWEVLGESEAKLAILVPPTLGDEVKKELGYGQEIPFHAKRSGDIYRVETGWFVKKVNEQIRADAEKRKREGVAQGSIFDLLFGTGPAEPRSPPTVDMAVKVAPEGLNLRLWFEGTLKGGDGSSTRLQAELLGKPEAGYQLVIEFFAGQGQPARRLAVGQPFRVPLSLGEESRTVFRVFVLDPDGKPLDSEAVHYRVRLGGLVAPFALADREGARVRQAEQKFDQAGDEARNPVMVKWIFPAAAGGEFARVLQQTPAGKDDVNLEVEVHFRPKAPPSAGRPPA